MIVHTPRYQPVDRKTTQVGCGTRFTELRTFILDTQTGKLVRDIGAAKWSQEKALQVAASMNARAA